MGGAGGGGDDDGLGKVMVVGVTVRLGLTDGRCRGLGEGVAGDEDGEALIEGEGDGVGWRG